MDPVTARASLVHKVQRTAQRYELAHRAIQRRHVPADHAPVTRLGASATFGQRDVNRVFVNVHSYKQSARLIHGLPPLVGSCQRAERCGSTCLTARNPRYHGGRPP